MILWAGVALWALAAALMWQVAAGGGGAGRLIASRSGAILAGLLLLLSGLLCFRPEEIVFSGEDPGAYINTAVELKSQGDLFYRDALYGELSESQKRAFRYGHSGFGLTKDAALWIKDLDAATMGPWFQPAYPLMMGAAAWLLPDYVVFMVVPLFAILNAVLLALLAHYLTGRRMAGLLAFLFYLLNPVTAWNARCPRPEVIASFFILSGLFLLVRMIRSEDAFTFRRAFFAGLALALAPLLHITALFVLVPATLLFLCLAPYRIRGWIGWWVAIAVGLILLVLEIRNVTDCYRLWRFIDPVGRSGSVAVLIVGVSAGCGVIGLVAWGVRRRIRAVTRLWSLVLGVGASVLTLLTCAYVFSFRSKLGAIPFLPESTSAYLSLTDLKGVASLVSWPLGVAAVAGIIAMFIRRDEGWSARFLLLIVLFPSVMTIGWMTHYMFETRRAVLTLVPVMTLGLACGLTILGGSARRARVGWALLAAIVLLVWPIPSRLFLYTTWSLKGTYGFYRELAAVVKQEKGIIVGEYTPLMSPFEHLFGIPVLSIDTAHRSDEEVGVAAESVAEIVRRHPDRTVFLVTPFSQPVIVGVTLDPVLSCEHQARTLGRATGRIPAGAKTSSIELHLFRMRLQTPGESVVLPFVRQLDEGRLGCSGLSKQMPSRAVIWSGIACPASRPIDVRWEATNGIAASEIYLFFSGDGAARPGGRISSEGSELEAQWYPLGSDWCVARLPARAGAQLSGVRVEAASNLVLIQVSALVGSGSSRLSIAGITTDNACKTSIASESRWLRQNAMLDLPDGQPTGLRLLVLSRGDRDGQDAVRVNVTRKGDLAAACLDTLTDWSWSVLSFPAREDPQAQDHFLFSSETAWDSGKSGFPSDLGFRLSRVVVLPALP